MLHLRRTCLRAALALGALSSVALLPSACGELPASSESGVRSLWALPAGFEELAGERYFEHPWPSDLRNVEGKVSLRGWPNPRTVLLLDEYIGFIEGKLDGYSTLASGYLRFDGALDPASLPDPGEALEPGASVQLVDVDPDSPERGQRRRVLLQFVREPGVYWQANTLAFMPLPGFPLRPKTRYALVVTSAVRAEGGGPVEAASELRQALGLEASEGGVAEASRAQLAPIVAELEQAGVAASAIVHLTSFTTNDPAAEYLAAADALPSQIEAPTADPTRWELRQSTTYMDEYTGWYGPSPNYQQGKLPYSGFGDGGGFVLDPQGVPQVVNEFDLRFSLSVPNAAACPMPAGGYPIVLYAHGTTGDYRSYVADGTARSLTERCVASMGVDQILHGERPGAPANDTSIERLFFNFLNIEAARTNLRQSGLDEVQRARLYTESGLEVPAAISATGAAIRFDGDRLGFFGHSQGSLNGPLFLAGSDAAKGGVLSGASALIQITLVDKTEPAPSVATLVKSLVLQLNDEEAEEVTLLHPPLALAQTLVDPVDPAVYARYLVREPHTGAPKSIYQTEGIAPDGTGDSYAPPRGCEAFAMAIGLPIAEPVVRFPPDATWGGLERVSIPAEGLSGNLAGGAATGALAQFDPGSRDGHFVVFDVPEARAQAAGFLASLLSGAPGTIPAP